MTQIENDEIIDLVHAVHNTAVAHLGGPTVFEEALWAEAQQRHWMHARETVVLGDNDILATRLTDGIIGPSGKLSLLPRTKARRQHMPWDTLARQSATS